MQDLSSLSLCYILVIYTARLCDSNRKKSTKSKKVLRSLKRKAKPTPLHTQTAIAL